MPLLLDDPPRPPPSLLFLPEVCEDPGRDKWLVGMGEADRAPYGERNGEAIRISGAFVGSYIVSSPESSPDINLAARGLKDDAAAGLELVRDRLSLLAFIAEVNADREDTWRGFED